MTKPWQQETVGDIFERPHGSSAGFRTGSQCVSRLSDSIDADIRSCRTSKLSAATSAWYAVSHSASCGQDSRIQQRQSDGPAACSIADIAPAAGQLAWRKR